MNYFDASFFEVCIIIAIRNGNSEIERFTVGQIMKVKSGIK